MRRRLLPAESFRFLLQLISPCVTFVLVMYVPGGPYIRHPLGGLIPIVLNLSACSIGSTMASTNSSICFSRPPMSVYVSVGRSSTSIALTRESNSAGRVSRMRYESLFTPTRSPGLSFSGGTRPISGRKTV